MRSWQQPPHILEIRWGGWYVDCAVTYLGYIEIYNETYRNNQQNILEAGIL